MPLKAPMVAVGPWQLVHAGPGPPSAGSRKLGSVGDGNLKPAGGPCIPPPSIPAKGLMSALLLLYRAFPAAQSASVSEVTDSDAEPHRSVPIFAWMVTVPGLSIVMVVPPVWGSSWKPT